MEDRFQLRERLGVGGSAVVWRAHDVALERDVALKVLSATAAPDPVELERMRQEARVAAGLRHPHIVEIFDYGEAPGMPGENPIPYVVMELVEGRTLNEVLAAGPLPWRDAVTVCSQVAAALAAAHAAGVVHRDIKPGNIMIGDDGVKLVDFGISASAGSADETDGELLGTPAYLAPERLDGGPVRPASDVYGTGLLLYRALTGRMPWQATSVTEMVRAHLHADPGPLPRIDGLPRSVVSVLRRCLAKNPADRPTAADLARTLDDALRRRRAPAIRLRRLSSARSHPPAVARNGSAVAPAPSAAAVALASSAAAVAPASSAAAVAPALSAAAVGPSAVGSDRSAPSLIPAGSPAVPGTRPVPSARSLLLSARAFGSSVRFFGSAPKVKRGSGVRSDTRPLDLSFLDEEQPSQTPGAVPWSGRMSCAEASTLPPGSARPWALRGGLSRLPVSEGGSPRRVLSATAAAVALAATLLLGPR
ncbi:serine/threonine-protein kinase [Actinoplanes sp. N902-109]|uniref:serine/threonine-protein kinase n=1 Tax=Actinoplanes sp. (strain N902-109) TaxID=649831 RepID=UPI0003295555|nr:serine/threonine-protein kinase [Actinoplanes sp. N902-109]AGL17632.1 serine/threonine protein kinase [Actinoplanes sp. N902-109]